MADKPQEPSEDSAPEGDSVSALEQKADALIAGMGALTKSHGALTLTVEKLAGATEANTKQITTVGKKGQRSREFIYGIIVSVVFDIGMSIGFGILAVQAHHAADRANDSLHTQKITCEASNGSRADSKKIWDEALALFSDNKKPTPAQTTKGKTFQAFVEKTYAPRDCDKILKPDVTVQDLTPTIEPTQK